MEINIRQWLHDDLAEIQHAWLEYCRNVARSDMQLKPGADAALMEWLLSRFGRHSSIGFVADHGGAVAGFLIGRVDNWDSVPPVIEPRRIGIIDAVHVNDGFRRQGIGTRLIERGIEAMRAENAIAVETIYDAWSDASTQTWHRAGFAPWMVHAYRML